MTNLISADRTQLKDLENGLITLAEFTAQHHDCDPENPFDMEEILKLYAIEVERYNENDAENYRIVLDCIDISTSARLQEICANTPVDERSGFKLFGEIKRMTSLDSPANQQRIQDEYEDIKRRVRDKEVMIDENMTLEDASELIEHIYYLFKNHTEYDVERASSLAKLLLDILELIPGGHVQMFASMHKSIFRTTPTDARFMDGRGFVDMCIMQLDTFLKSSFSIGTSKTAQLEGEMHRMQGQSRGTYKPRAGSKPTASGAPASYRVITECPWCDAEACPNKAKGSKEACAAFNNKVKIRFGMPEGRKAYLTQCRVVLRNNPKLTTLKGVRVFGKLFANMMQSMLGHEARWEASQDDVKGVIDAEMRSRCGDAVDDDDDEEYPDLVDIQHTEQFNMLLDKLGDEAVLQLCQGDQNEIDEIASQVGEYRVMMDAHGESAEKSEGQEAGQPTCCAHESCDRTGQANSSAGGMQTPDTHILRQQRLPRPEDAQASHGGLRDYVVGSAGLRDWLAGKQMPQPSSKTYDASVKEVMGSPMGAQKSPMQTSKLQTVKTEIRKAADGITYTRKEFNEYYGMQRAPQEWALATKAGYKITTSVGQTLPGVYRPLAERGAASPMQESSVQSVSPRTEPQMRKKLVHRRLEESKSEDDAKMADRLQQEELIMESERQAQEEADERIARGTEIVEAIKDSKIQAQEDEDRRCADELQQTEELATQTVQSINHESSSSTAQKQVNSTTAGSPQTEATAGDITAMIGMRVMIGEVCEQQKYFAQDITKWRNATNNLVKNSIEGLRHMQKSTASELEQLKEDDRQMSVQIAEGLTIARMQSEEQRVRIAAMATQMLEIRKIDDRLDDVGTVANQASASVQELDTSVNIMTNQIAELDERMNQVEGNAKCLNADTVPIEEHIAERFEGLINDLKEVDGQTVALADANRQSINDIRSQVIEFQSGMARNKETIDKCLEVCMDAGQQSNAQLQQLHQQLGEMESTNLRKQNAQSMAYSELERRVNQMEAHMGQEQNTSTSNNSSMHKRLRKHKQRAKERATQQRDVRKSTLMSIMALMLGVMASALTTMYVSRSSMAMAMPMFGQLGEDAIRATEARLNVSQEMHELILNDGGATHLVDMDLEGCLPGTWRPDIKGLRIGDKSILPAQGSCLKAFQMPSEIGGPDLIRRVLICPNAALRVWPQGVEVDMYKSTYVDGPNEQYYKLHDGRRLPLQRTPNGLRWLNLRIRTTQEGTLNAAMGAGLEGLATAEENVLVLGHMQNKKGENITIAGCVAEGVLARMVGVGKRPRPLTGLQFLWLAHNMLGHLSSQRLRETLEHCIIIDKASVTAADWRQFDMVPCDACDTYRMRSLAHGPIATARPKVKDEKLDLTEHKASPSRAITPMYRLLLDVFGPISIPSAQHSYIYYMGICDEATGMRWLFGGKTHTAQVIEETMQRFRAALRLTHSHLNVEIVRTDGAPEFNKSARWAAYLADASIHNEKSIAYQAWQMGAVERTWGMAIPNASCMMGVAKSGKRHHYAASRHAVFLGNLVSSKVTMMDGSQQVSSAFMRFYQHKANANGLLPFWTPMRYHLADEQRDSKFDERSQPCWYAGISPDNVRAIWAWDGNRYVTVGGSHVAVVTDYLQPPAPCVPPDDTWPRPPSDDASPQPVPARQTAKAPVIPRVSREVYACGDRLRVRFFDDAGVATWYAGKVEQTQIQNSGRTKYKITWDDTRWAHDPRWQGFIDLQRKDGPQHEYVGMATTTGAPQPVVPPTGGMQNPQQQDGNNSKALPASQMGGRQSNIQRANNEMRTAGVGSDTQPPIPTLTRRSARLAGNVHNLVANDVKRVLILFAGRAGTDQTTTGERLRQLQIEVDEIDLLIGGVSHNMLKMRPRMEVIEAVRSGKYDAIWMAPPCGTWSVVREPKLRTGKHTMGLPNLSKEEQLLVDRTNELANITAVIAHIAGSLGIPWFIEQPADRGDLTSDAYWDEIDDPPHMFNMPVFRNLRAVAQPQMITFPQCALDANAQKFTTIMASKDMQMLLKPFADLRCTHTQHKEVLRGVDDNGQYRSSQAAKYPPMMAIAVAKLLNAAIMRRGMVTEKEQMHAMHANAQIEENAQPNITREEMNTNEPTGYMAVAADINAHDCACAAYLTSDEIAEVQHEQGELHVAGVQTKEINTTPLGASQSWMVTLAEEGEAVYLFEDAMHDGSLMAAAKVKKRKIDHKTVIYYDEKGIAKVIEPLTMKEAFASLQEGQWRIAVDKEWEAMKASMHLEPRPKRGRVFKFKFVYTVKTHADQKLDKFKARCSVNTVGCQEGLHWHEKFMTGAAQSTVKSVVGLVAAAGWLDLHADVKEAFLGTDVDTDIYVEQPKDLPIEVGPNGEELVWKLDKAVYGLVQAGRLFAERLATALREIGLEQSLEDEALWRLDHQLGRIILATHVDDLIGGGSTPEVLAHLKKELEARGFEFGQWGKWRTVLGFGVTRDLKKRTVSLTANKYIAAAKEEHLADEACQLNPGMPSTDEVDSLAPAGEESDEQRAANEGWRRKARSLKGVLIYISSVHPAILQATSKVCAHMAMPTHESYRAAKRILAWLVIHKDLAITFGGRGVSSWEDLITPADTIEPMAVTTPMHLTCAVDSDLNKAVLTPGMAEPAASDTGASRSQIGYVISFMGGPLEACSKRQHSTALDSAAAEVFAASSAVAKLMSIRGVLRFASFGVLGNEPTPIFCDNEAACMVTRNATSVKRLSYIARRCRFMQECQGTEILIKDISGLNNPADAFTKHMKIKATWRLYMARIYNASLTQI